VNRVYRARWPYLFIFFLILHFLHLPAALAEKPAKKSEEQKVLERYANSSLRRLKNAIKSEGFFNARVALNIWKSTALDAGIFDEDLYNKLKQELYEKSVIDNLRWYEIFLLQKNYKEARVCLQLYRMHAEEINIFDEEKYEELKERIQK